MDHRPPRFELANHRPVCALRNQVDVRREQVASRLLGRGSSPKCGNYGNEMISAADPNRAVSEMITLTKARNDTDLMRRLGYSTSTNVMCNVRAGRTRINGNMLYRLACLVDLPMTEIKRRLGID
jgi:hypothetical protein